MNQGFQKIKLIYYTDPVCSTCWTFEPYLFKFFKCYESFIEVEYRMGGLLHDWEKLPLFDKRVSNERFLRELWDAESERFQIGIDSAIWNKKGIHSSYPCCIAYYAVLEQGKERADKFLRNLRMFLFICGKDISLEASLLTCAIQSDVDVQLYREAIASGSAEKQFKVHLEQKEKDRVKHFPSFILENAAGERRKLLNITDYQFFDEVLLRVDQFIHELTNSTIFKKRKYVSPMQLLQRFEYLSFKQLHTICELDQDIIAHELASEVSNGSVICEWHNSFAHYKINKTPFHIKRRVGKDQCAVIGGGIAGSFLKLAMDKVGIHTAVYEKNMEASNRGFGFLILQNGLEALDSIGLKNAFFKKGNHMNYFKAVQPDETVIYTKVLDNCVAISRQDMVELFRDELADSTIKYGKVFKDFSSDDPYSVTFEDGSHCEADLIVGADGTKSVIREKLFGVQQLQEVGEREIVCMVNVPGLPFQLDEFYKVIDSEKGKSIGVIPLSSDRYIWFLQVNHRLDPIDSKDPGELRSYALRSIEHFPEKVKDLVRSSDFEQSFLWISQRMDHLPDYYKNNCVLLGDASHPLLPLTSQGANSAMEDAATLATIWSEYRGETDVTGILNRYQNLRKEIVEHYISDGDALAEDFMLLSKNKKFKLPLTIH